jgi:N-methylhydantoinase A
MGYVIGVDIGGTFTDAVVVAGDGQMVLGKASTTPEDFSVGFFRAVAAAAEKLGRSEHELLGATTKLAHGTTIGINALVTGNVATAVLLATKGHGDAIRAMGGQGRTIGASIEELLDYRLSSKPDPVVPRERVVEITERIDYAGDVVVPLSHADLDGAVEVIRASGATAVAISFLWGFVNPAHEQQAAAHIRAALPGVFVSCSHEVAPRIGEYGRTVATVMNAQLGPLMDEYIGRIIDGARVRGFGGEVLFGQIEGGLIPASEARGFPIFTVQSGPVAGVVGSAIAGAAMNYPNVIVTDMGGTTLDVATIAEGRVSYGAETELVRQLAFLRNVDVESIGAGGGSIAWIDQDTGRLRVGPQSAGAVPGPICYGRGGSQVTVTDADLVLGVLNPDRPLADGLRLDVAAAHQGVVALGAQLGLDAYECAAGIVEIIDTRMEDLIRRVTVQRGQDPRQFSMWAFGGASGAHAGLYGRGIGVRDVVFPLSDMASVWSAYGLALLDQTRTFQANALLRTPFDLARLGTLVRRLEDQALAYADAHGMAAVELVRRAAMKYPLQVYEVEVDLPSGEVDEKWADEVIATFHDTYEARFGRGSGYAAAGATLTALRVTARSSAPAPPLQASPARTVARDPHGSRLVYWRELGARTGTAVYWGPDLGPGSEVAGPAIVEYPNTTIAVRPGQTLRIDAFGSGVLSLGEGRG